jgi:uncharacterized protein YkwD
VSKLRLIIIASLSCLAALMPATASAKPHRLHGVRACANADVPVGNASLQAMRDAVVCLVNQQRAAHGLPALKHSAKLDRSAQGWTNAMVSHSFFSHGSNFASRITAVGFDWSNAGENIATGFYSPNAVVAAWMHSTHHCRNILDPVFSFVGTGVNGNPVSGYASGPGTWTQDFALPMGQRAPSHNFGPSSGCPY